MCCYLFAHWSFLGRGVSNWILDKEKKMSYLSVKLGFWSAFLSAVAFIVFTVCFVAILMVSPMFMWTDLSAYVAYVHDNNQIFQHLARLTMLLFGPLFVVLLNSVHDYAAEDKKILTRIGICFGVGFAVLICSNYFVQLSIVRQSITQGHLEGLGQIVQANPASAVSAINMLGWSLFLGLSSLFVAPVFSGSRLEKVIKIMFLLNGLSCILGGIGYVFEFTLLLFFSINFGMGGSVTIITILLCVLFKRLEKSSPVGYL